MTSLSREFARLKLSVSAEIEQKLQSYIDELRRWNARINLTALEGQDLYRRLVAEPLWIGRQLQMSGTLLDLGSGNGSPGIPLYLGCCLERADLVEARVKRAAFLRHVASRLQASGIVVHRSRLEDMEVPSGAVSWITMQGVKPGTGVVAAMQRLFPSTTRVVWITSGASDVTSSESLVVPESSTIVRVLQLDQF